MEGDNIMMTTDANPLMKEAEPVSVEKIRMLRGDRGLVDTQVGCGIKDLGSILNSL